MLVYGDRSRRTDPRVERAAISAAISALSDQPAGIERHAALVSALIAAGELAQGLADEAFAAAGRDARTPVADAAMALTLELARLVWASWRNGFALGSTAAAITAVERLAALPLPPEVTLKEGEGYAFYALYPETYAEAAVALTPEPTTAPTTVMGLRSIGTSLAAMVAAGLEAGGSPAEIVTLRPTGPPFRRELRPAPEVAAELFRDPGRRVAVVDEGPGLSGSSFGAALDFAEAHGVPRDRLLAFPSHGGDLGLQARDIHRARWTQLSRPHVSFETAIAPRLGRWAEDLTGPATAPPQDLSGGAWRSLRYASEAEWPAANAAQERRKFLLRSDHGAFLLKFAGLGRIGERKLERARRLADAGFTPEPLGLRHGFLLERWIDLGAAPDLPRADLLARLADYLGFRARVLPAEADSGADIRGLFEMLRANVNEGLGRKADKSVDPWRPVLSELASLVRPVVTDSRMHRQEWIVSPEGRLLKIDALDHAEGHDLIGCQDIAWDVAGAMVEFELDHDEAAALHRGVAGRSAEPALLAFYEQAYLAFQLGSYTMAADAHTGWPDEAARLGLARDRYLERLGRSLARAVRS